MTTSSRFLPHAERLVWLGFMLFLLITTMIYIYRGFGLERDVSAANQEVLALQMRLASLTAEQVLEPARLGLTQGQIRHLQRLGLNDPRVRLVEDLAGQPELIRHAAVHGGRMHFVPDETHVLSDRWVLAVFEDGHIRGRMLLEYEVAFGNITWQVLASSLD
ncbi:hypothetical protein [Ectothiorhodospira lacustris]|uniref:hypothetical protein n=1 Tax=Ectothiorhodospira lacustris TaxID=2899127 RepID=UPI001EE8E99D|nr:hypothetical protein [Ectothiorhodospira lacustris]MCG5500146.1 hypothetical protein [Ectothiorhodospira lacustris]MCG5510769.1 hypothetical protein [Ectothiorhodospira lacustris]MCG5522501.1 hypothetical protein [Ectothiorhodospira lacustris]